MKKFNILFGLIFLSLCACSQLEEDTLGGSLTFETSTSDVDTHITVNQAVQVANNVISENTII